MKFRLMTARWFGSVGLWILACSLCWAGTPDQEKTTATGLRKFYTSASECKRCHDTEKEEDPPLICRCNQYTIWHEQDVHRNAYRFLTYDRATHIGELMKKNVLEEQTGCLHCHGVFVNETKERKSLAPEGVTCVVCHGPYKEWVEKHWLDRKMWRDLPPQSKEKQFGMTNLWDPHERAKVCASCHIGNGADKNVTHEMYAAGHPPLPSFALEPFSEFMPPHWESVQGKKERGKKYPEIESKLTNEEKTKSIVIGGMVEFLQTISSFEEQAKACAQKGADPRQIDFAQFDCYACHHELKKDSWRQKRSYPKMTGRPQLPAWPSPLVTLGIRHAHRDEPLERSNQILRKKLEKIQNALECRPFGNPEEVASAAHDLVVWLDGIIKRLNEKSCKYDQVAAEKLLNDLFELNKGKLLDYESARQVFWAFRIIYKELKPDWDQDSEYKRLIEPFNKLRPDLRVNPFNVDPLISNLANSLRVMSEYEPEKFRKDFQALQKLLPH